MNRKLYTRMLQILFAVLLSLATACDEDNGGGNEDPKPSKFSVTLSVKDVSASTASVETTPNDNTVHYFCDAVTKAEYDKAGEDAFIAGLLESYEVQLEEGETFAQFWEKKSKRGKGSWTLSGLTPQTEYYTFAFAVDTNSGEVLSKVFLSEAFTTADAPTGETGPTINRLEVSPAAQDPKTKLEMELQVTDATKNICTDYAQSRTRCGYRRRRANAHRDGYGKRVASGRGTIRTGNGGRPHTAHRKP